MGLDIVSPFITLQDEASDSGSAFFGEANVSAAYAFTPKAEVFAEAGYRMMKTEVGFVGGTTTSTLDLDLSGLNIRAGVRFGIL